MLGTIHWMTPTDAVPALCIEMRSPVVVTGFWAMTHCSALTEPDALSGAP